MVQFFQEQASPREKFASSFSSGIARGLQGLLDSHQKDKKASADTLGVFAKYMKQVDPDKRYTDRERKDMLDLAIGLSKSGLDPLQSTQLSESLISRRLQGESGLGDQIPSDKGGKSTSDKVQQLGNVPLSWPIDKLKSLFKDDPEARKERFQAAGMFEADPALMDKPLIEFSPEDFYRMPKERLAKLSPRELELVERKLGELGSREFATSYLGGALPLFTAGEKKLQESGFAPKPFVLPEGARKGAEFGGELTRDLALLEGAGALSPAGALPRAATTGALMGTLGSQGALKQAEQGQTPTIASTLEAAAPWAAWELAIPAAVKAFPIIKDWFSKVPELAKSMLNIGKKTGQSAEAVIENATAQAAAKGVDVEAAARGDAKAINAIKEEAKLSEARADRAEKETDSVLKSAEVDAKFEYPLSGRVKKEGEKIGAKAAVFEEAPGVSRREQTLERLKSEATPLEEYLETPQYQQPLKTAQGQLARDLREKPIRERIVEIKPQLQNAARSVYEGEYALQNLKVRGVGEDVLKRVETKIASDKAMQERLLSELKANEFYLRNGKFPSTPEQIQAQIEDTLNAYREAAKDPTNSEKWIKTRERLDKDKKYLDEAAKLIERGEIPGPEILDQFIKIEQSYLKAYDDLIKELDSVVKKGGKAVSGPKIEEAKRLRDLIKEIRAVNEAKTTRQIDKRKALSALKKPSGAFYKQVLNDARQNVGQFGKELFKSKKVLSPEEMKTKIAAKKVFKAQEPPKAAPAKAEQPSAPVKKESVQERTKREFEEAYGEGKKAGENPTDKNIQDVAEETGIPKEGIKDTWEKIHRGAEKVKAGTATNETIEQTSTAVSKMIPRYLKGAALSSAVGVIQGFLENEFGWKPPKSLFTGISALIGAYSGKGSAGSVVGGAAGTTFLGNEMYKMVNSAYEDSEAKKLLKSRRSAQQFSDHVRDLRNRYKPAKANRIVKKSREMANL